MIPRNLPVRITGTGVDGSPFDPYLQQQRSDQNLQHRRHTNDLGFEADIYLATQRAITGALTDQRVNTATSCLRRPLRPGAMEPLLPVARQRARARPPIYLPTFIVAALAQIAAGYHYLRRKFF